MPTYDLDVDKPLEKKGSGLGCSIGGWFVFAVVAVITIFLGYRTWFYYQKLKAGELVVLPQFEDRLTSTGKAPAAAALIASNRADVESDKSPAFGADKETAQLVIVEFADFECPYSKEEALVVRSMMQKYGDKVRFEYRDFPLEEIHHDARRAAVAARCAQEQGKFWAYHDKLYVNSPTLTSQMLSQFAAEIGLEPVQFQKCFEGERYQAAVDNDMATAQRLGITGTPTFYFNGKRVDGAIPADVFEDLVQKMIK